MSGFLSQAFEVSALGVQEVGSVMGLSVEGLSDLVSTFTTAADPVLESVGLAPVSYTHLTLPTNREV